jgi:NADP-dependent 3-hydroxy acid dehydrogenase YdfG
MAQDLKGKKAVITGASSGIGEATARALVDLGADVALLARRADRVQALAEELGAKGVKAIAIEGDVTDREGMQAAAKQGADALGGVDVLINNAGQMLLGAFSDDQAEEHRRMIDTNLMGAITTASVFLEQLQADGGGDLVNISSVAGRTARPGSSVYNATKWGINGWSEALRQELQPDVRVIVIEPGAIATELTDHITDEQAKSGADKMYEDQAIPVEEVSEVIAFAVTRNRHTSLNEILIRPTKQKL